jgi:methanogenic corrinoid protein MtbC1
MSHGETSHWIPLEFESETDLSVPSEMLRNLGDAGRRAEGVAFRTALKLAIERDVIPRLILAERQKLDFRPLKHTITTRDINRFKNALLREELNDCASYVEALRESGVSRPAIYLELFAPVARQLGELWDSDALSFFEVSIATGRLQSMLNRIASVAEEIDGRDSNHRIALAAAPGEQHALGLSVLIEFFHMAGWYVAGGAVMETGAELSAAVENEWFGIVGLSASTEANALLLKADIAAVRQSSRNRRIAVIVGGHGFDDHPEISLSIGADGLATDGSKAVEEAERLLGGER